MLVKVEPTIGGHWRVSHAAKEPRYTRFQMRRVYADDYSFTREEATRVLDMIETEWGVHRKVVRFV